MRRAATVMAIILGLARAAGADATVPSATTAPDPLVGCSMGSSPLWRAQESGVDAKASAAAGGGSLTSVGRTHLVVAKAWEEKQPMRTVVLRAGSLARVATAEGTFAPFLVEDEGGGLVGLLGIATRSDEVVGFLRLDAPDGRQLWTSPGMLLPESSMAALAAGDLIVIAAFHRIATGSRLFAVDRKTGRLRWSAEVAQLRVSHSKYWNDVTLALDGGRIVMRGYEAGGCYLQTFDLATGRRLSSHTPTRR